MKKINVRPFRRFWQDCFNCIVYSLTDYSQDVPELYYYNNMYSYIFTNEKVTENGEEYKSIVPWMDNFRLVDELTTNREKVQVYNMENPIEYIKEKVDEEKVILLGIDLFYWINEGLHYMNNHIIHMSLVIGYDDDTEELIVLETGNDMFAEHRVPYDRATQAIKASTLVTRVSDLNKEYKVKMFTLDDLEFYAKNIISSIDEIIRKKEDIWKIENASDEGLFEVLSIIQTHMFSMQNRAKINGYMFENAFKSDTFSDSTFHDSFNEIAADFEKLKGACIKAQYKNDKKKAIDSIKSKMFILLNKERQLWTAFEETSEKMGFLYA
jgi:hypothetical protein